MKIVSFIYSLFKPMKLSLIIIVISIFDSSLWAEDVFVKFRGPITLDGYTCSAVLGSFISRVCYNTEYSYMIILLGDTYYHYCRVPTDLVNKLLEAESKGVFYNSYIKHNFDCRLGDVPSVNH